MRPLGSRFDRGLALWRLHLLWLSLGTLSSSQSYQVPLRLTSFDGQRFQKLSLVGSMEDVASGPLGLVSFTDFDWFCERTQVSVVVHAKELYELYGAMAELNGATVDELLANSAIQAGKQLKCCQITRKPRDWSWLPDSEGYLQPKLKQSCTFVGHSYSGDRMDGDHRQRKRAVPSASADGPSPSSPPQRAKRARKTTEKWQQWQQQSPGSPEGELAGCTQPVPIRLHKAAFLACCPSPEAAQGLEIRHICGNPRCGVVSHFRAGTKLENEQDREYHARHRGCSRQSFPPLQQ